MEIKTTNFKDLLICNPKVHKDERGYFYESFNSQEFYKHTGQAPAFVQDNESRSGFGVLRGLHFQKGNKAQAKLVRVLNGEVLDVVVDLRKDQPTYGKSFSIVLSSKNKTQLYVPRGFAHGFLVLSTEATFFYKCDNYYDKESESGLRYDDPALGINWHLPQEDLILSEKDKVLPTLETLQKLL
jgi:dTDP-4-dehydrorhamnose 3,5-epimerase